MLWDFVADQLAGNLKGVDRSKAVAQITDEFVLGMVQLVEADDLCLAKVPGQESYHVDLGKLSTEKDEVVNVSVIEIQSHLVPEARRQP